MLKTSDLEIDHSLNTSSATYELSDLGSFLRFSELQSLTLRCVCFLLLLTNYYKQRS